MQQETRDAFAASTPAQEDSPEIRAYLERIFGPLELVALDARCSASAFTSLAEFLVRSEVLGCLDCADLQWDLKFSFDVNNPTNHNHQK
ncbi:hypothetical protein PMIT1327_01935 [Prochlorococcus marinus str. MIT 1327]|nr:hypothetical protein PMIT1312_02688 [Prochlorococcus marinus str. MIT 1312]KZR79872.1 hypothetical protein PMIT1327_01935 [Prochlorococcus marinus str. MIT 1327]